MNKKLALVDLNKDIVLVTRVHIFCTALFNVYKQQHNSRDSN